MRLLIAAILLFSHAAYADEFNDDIQIFTAAPSVFVQMDILDLDRGNFAQWIVGAAIPVSRRGTLGFRVSHARDISGNQGKVRKPGDVERNGQRKSFKFSLALAYPVHLGSPFLCQPSLFVLYRAQTARLLLIYGNSAEETSFMNPIL